MPDERNAAFVSYSQKDKRWLDAVLPHLKAALPNNEFEVWSDQEIREGEDWYERIQEMLGRTKFAVCLISANFLTSSFCMDEEIPYFLENEEELEILPVLVRPCPWQAHPWLKRTKMYTAGGKSKALASVSTAARDEIFAKLAMRLFEASAVQAIAWVMPEAVDITRLPETGFQLFGRRDELNFLDKAWERDDTNIVVFKAFGGVGKSTLVRNWTEAIAKDNYRGAEAVYAWSFYSQGTSERVTSADQFIAAALEFFGDPEPQKGSPWDRGERLAELVSKQKTLLLLDGMEPLQSGYDFDRGEIKDPALKTLLEGLAERNPGLCVISTREEVTDLSRDRQGAVADGLDNRSLPVAAQSPVVHVDLEKVSTVAGRALLRTGGVPGTDAELEGLVEGFGNHALALNLLGAYLKWPGRLEEIPELPDIPEEQGRHARRVMAAFAKVFGEGPELDLLRVLGLFDGPVEETVVEALLVDPAIEGLTEHVGRDGALAGAQATLRRAGMLAIESRHKPPRLDSHPLVREHFGGALGKERPEAWRAGHGWLFEHCRGVAEEQPSTLEGLAPLYAAVAHGCAAGLYQETFYEVYYRRINRAHEFYAVRKLGAFGSDLAAVSSFFEKPWSAVAGGLAEGEKAYLLNQSGCWLRALGRLREAVAPMDAGMHPDIEREEWGGACRSGLNLSELQLTRGDVAAAVEYGRRAVEYADRSGDEFLREAMRTTQADAEHQAGRLESAEELFREAERLQQERQSEYPLLYSLQGYRYCDLLLAQGQAAEARRRAKQTLEWDQLGGQGSLLDIALDQLTLGRAALALGEVARAAECLREAVDAFRAGGRQDHLPRGLLARAELHRSQGDFERAHRDLREVEKIARRGEMRLFLTDYHLESARLALAESDPAAAREHFAKGRDLVDETGYHRRDRDLAEIEAQLTSAASES